MPALTISASLPLPLVNHKETGADLGVAWSPDGAVLAVARPGHPIRLWDPAGGTLRKILREVDQPVARALMFSPDNSRLASILADGRVQVWDCETGDPVPLVSDNRFDSPALSWSPDAHCIAAARHRSLEMWESYSGLPSRRVDAGFDISALAWSPRGDLVAIAGRGTIKLWKRDLVPHATPRLTGPKADEEVLSLAWAPEGERLFAAGSSGRIYRWNISKMAADQTIEAHTAAIIGLAVSADGSILASKSLDGTLRLWDASRLIPVSKETEGARSSTFRVLAFHPSRLLLASADSDQSVVTIRSFDPSSGQAGAGLPRPVKIFFSYSRTDESFRRKLFNHLFAYEESGRISCWYDGRISPGNDWKETIEGKVGECDIAVCLVTAESMNSQNCRAEHDLILARYDADRLPVLSLVLRPFDFDKCRLSRFQAGPLYGAAGKLKPASKWNDRDAAFVESARWIMQKVEDILPDPR
jgi:WD40 repeat protein